MKGVDMRGVNMINTDIMSMNDTVVAGTWVLRETATHSWKTEMDVSGSDAIEATNRAIRMLLQLRAEVENAKAAWHGPLCPQDSAPSCAREYVGSCDLQPRSAGGADAALTDLSPDRPATTR